MLPSIKKQAQKDLKSKIKSMKQQLKDDIKSLKLQHLTDMASSDQKAALKLEKEQVRKYNETLPKRYTIGEEICNSITHGIGAGLAIAGLVVLLVHAFSNAPLADRGFYMTSYAIYGSSLVILYLMSTLYHALTPYGAKKVFSVFDHNSIYLLISGTYTPFCLTTLRSTSGWLIFGIIWGLTIIGITFYSIYGNRIRIISVVTYLLMGWIIIFPYGTMKQNLPPVSITFLLIGGAFYTIGVIFYALKKIKWMHCIWHLFTIAGSIFHYFSIYYAI
ncbi:MAG: PAQR family membrane homeostasis protein TrhA [Treponemataceae bacterium]